MSVGCERRSAGVDPRALGCDVSSGDRPRRNLWEILGRTTDYPAGPPHRWTMPTLLVCQGMEWFHDIETRTYSCLIPTSPPKMSEGAPPGLKTSTHVNYEANRRTGFLVQRELSRYSTVLLESDLCW